MTEQNSTPEPKVKLIVARNGPLRIRGAGEMLQSGELTIEWSDGEAVTPANPDAFTICRCGASASKPFCDGSHSKLGFDIAAAAVPESRE